MKKIYPQKLSLGDEVRVIAPSQTMSIIGKDCREIANRRYADLGLKLTFGKNIEESDIMLSSSIKSRIEDLHAAFSDKNVKGVITVIGGFNANQLLRYIDWDLIKNNPKIFCGFSDITALNNSIYAKTGLVTYSGPHYSTFGKMFEQEYSFEYYRKCLFSNEPFEIEPSREWDDRRWWLDQNDRKSFANPGWQIINEGEAIGPILGANVCTFELLQGTEYMPNLDNSILFIEDDHMTNAVEFDRNLQSLIHLPDFSKVKGLVIGRFQVASEMTPEKLEFIIKTKAELNRMPVIAGVDFGHTDPKITFPIGGTARIRISKNDSKIEILEH